jgi:hypothetical protein
MPEAANVTLPVNQLWPETLMDDAGGTTRRNSAQLGKTEREFSDGLNEVTTPFWSARLLFGPVE